MLNKNQIKDFMSAMNEAGVSNPMDVSLEDMTIFADTQGVQLDEVIEFCQIAEEMNFSGLDFKVPTKPGVSEQEIGLLVEDYRAWLKEKNLKNNLKSLQDYLKEKSQNEEVTKELLVKIPRFLSENKITELSDEEKPAATEPKAEETPAPKADEPKKPEEETQHSDTEETDKTPADPAKDEGKKGEEPKAPASEPVQMSDDEKKSAKEQLTNLKDKIAKADFADANSVKEFIECCGQVVELGKKFGKPEEFAKTVFDKPAEEPKADEGKKPEAPKTTPAPTTEEPGKEPKAPEGKPANFSGEDKPSKGKFDYFDLYLKK